MKNWPTNYKVLNDKKLFQFEDYSLIPLRFEDRYNIMKWRNEQLYHLRQEKKITKRIQDNYFNKIVYSQFYQQKPDQILFSFLEKSDCIGYGGLVHINWHDKSAEISFIINTSLENQNFKFYWELFLNLIKGVAFKELDLHKIFTYAFDLRPKLYNVLETNNFKEEARLKDHHYHNGNYCDVLIHSCLNPIHFLKIRKASPNDLKLLFSWRNEKKVRKNAFNSKKIDFQTHLNWFKNKISNKDTIIYIFETRYGDPIGQVRFDKIDDKWEIDYSVDLKYRNLGLGKIILGQAIKKVKDGLFIARVKNDNIASIKTFLSLGFKKKLIDNKFISFHMEL